MNCTTIPIVFLGAKAHAPQVNQGRPVVNSQECKHRMNEGRDEQASKPLLPAEGFPQAGKHMRC